MNIRRYLPLLHLYIEIPLISIRTVLMSERLESNSRDYIAIHIRIWKWKFEFGLYNFMKRAHERRI